MADLFRMTTTRFSPTRERREEGGEGGGAMEKVGEARESGGGKGVCVALSWLYIRGRRVIGPRGATGLCRLARRAPDKPSPKKLC